MAGAVKLPSLFLEVPTGAKMQITFLTWDENGLGKGEAKLPKKTISACITDGDLEVFYDAESHEVTLYRNDVQVSDFSEVPIPA
jgi:hypothetical protein